MTDIDNRSIDPQSVSDLVKDLTRQILLRAGVGLGCDEQVIALWRYVAALEALHNMTGPASGG